MSFDIFKTIDYNIYSIACFNVYFFYKNTLNIM